MHIYVPFYVNLHTKLGIERANKSQSQALGRGRLVVYHLNWQLNEAKVQNVKVEDWL